MATLWDAHAWLWHGYELRGLEHLPTQVLWLWSTFRDQSLSILSGRSTSCLLSWCNSCWLLLLGQQGSPLEGGDGAVGSRQISFQGQQSYQLKNITLTFASQVPGIKLVLEVFHCTPGTVDSLAELLKEGQILVGIVIMYNYAAVLCNLNWIEDADP